MAARRCEVVGGRNDARCEEERDRLREVVIGLVRIGRAEGIPSVHVCIDMSTWGIKTAQNDNGDIEKGVET